jgi:hypothetical protein
MSERDRSYLKKSRAQTDTRIALMYNQNERDWHFFQNQNDKRDWCDWYLEIVQMLSVDEQKASVSTNGVIWHETLLIMHYKQKPCDLHVCKLWEEALKQRHWHFITYTHTTHTHTPTFTIPVKDFMKGMVELTSLLLQAWSIGNWCGIFNLNPI